MVHGDYFFENSPQNTSLLQWLLLLIFSSFPNTTIITLKNVNNSGQRVSKFPQNFCKCPHNTIIPLSILNIFLKSPQNTLIPETLLLRSLEYVPTSIYDQGRLFYFQRATETSKWPKGRRRKTVPKVVL